MLTACLEHLALPQVSGSETHIANNVELAKDSLLEEIKNIKIRLVGEEMNKR